MVETKGPATLQGMFIGAQVPFELAGLIFKAFYTAGIKPSSFELAPVYSTAEVEAAIDDMRAKLSTNGSPLQITDGSKPRRKKRKIHVPVGGGMLAYLVSLINETPRNRDELRRLVAARGHWDVKSVDARMHDLLSRKFATRDGDGFLHITEKGRAVASPKAEEVLTTKIVRKRRDGKLTGAEAVRLALRPLPFPETMALQDIKKFFKKKNLRADSASVALNVMKTNGEVEAPEPARYRLTQQERNKHVQPSAT